MKPLVHHAGTIVPIAAANIDTDILVPKQYLKRVERTGLADYLFDRWRYLDRGNATDDPYVDCSARSPDPAFALNDPARAGATVLLTRDNFGCGSSREQAVWALVQWGIRVVIAPSFGDIFFNNCFASGLLPVTLDATAVGELFELTETPAYRLEIDLAAQTVSDDQGRRWSFDIDPFRKNTLLHGHDAVALTLAHAQGIAEFEQRHARAQPWLLADVPSYQPPPSGHSNDTQDRSTSR